MQKSAESECDDHTLLLHIFTIADTVVHHNHWRVGGSASKRGFDEGLRSSHRWRTGLYGCR